MLDHHEEPLSLGFHYEPAPVRPGTWESVCARGRRRRRARGAAAAGSVLALAAVVAAVVVVPGATPGRTQAELAGPPAAGPSLLGERIPAAEVQARGGERPAAADVALVARDAATAVRVVAYRAVDGRECMAALDARGPAVIACAVTLRDIPERTHGVSVEALGATTAPIGGPPASGPADQVPGRELVPAFAAGVVSRGAPTAVEFLRQDELLATARTSTAAEWRGLAFYVTAVDMEGPRVVRARGAGGDVVAERVW